MRAAIRRWMKGLGTMLGTKYEPGRTVRTSEQDGRRVIVTGGVYQGRRGTLIRADGHNTAMVKLDGAMSGTSIRWVDLRELTPVEGQ
jgi:hypothetical protein